MKAPVELLVFSVDKMKVLTINFMKGSLTGVIGVTMEGLVAKGGYVHIS